MQPASNQPESQNTWMRVSNTLKKRTDLTANAKLVYTHMLDKYIFFSRQDKSYHENMQDIANELGMAKRTVGDCIKKLEELQMLVIFKKNVHNSAKSVISYSYLVKDIYGIYKRATVTKIQRKYSEDEPF